MEYIGIDGLLSRLQGVKKTGPQRWVAKSPVRNERTASLSIRETEDGRVLLNDFGGGDVPSILAKLGISFIQLIPPTLRHARAEGKQAARDGFSPMDALRALEDDAIAIAIIANKIAGGEAPSALDLATLRRANERISAAMDATKTRRI